jgi:peptidoglycan hydrolase-like protein with peptidoglycan-binding domain
MISKRIATGLLAATMAMPAFTAPARADGGDVLGGLIVGGIIGSAIANDINRKKQRQRTTTYSSGVSSVTRAQNVETQTALNQFGFNVGTPDGSIGPRSRAAIAEYQAFIGYPATGELTEYQRNLLVTSYHRAIAGGPQTMQLAAQNPMGMKGLLIVWRDEALGVQPQTPVVPVAPVAPATTMAAQPVVPVQPVAPAAPAVTEAAVAPAPAAPAPAAPADGGKLPSFFKSQTQTQVSLASECNRIGLQTTANGGYITVATMSDPKAALGEQFCLARSYAIAIGEELARQVQGFTPDQIAEQCKGLVPAMADNVAALSIKPAADVIAATQGFVLASGMAPADLGATAKICLSVGYKTDDMAVAESAALILATLGEGAYGELLGHHLATGIGAAARPDLALAWYDMGLAAAANPATAVFAPGQADRLDLVKKAAYTLGGKADQAALPEAQPAGGVPLFKVPGTATQPATATQEATLAPLPAPAAQPVAQPEAPAATTVAAVTPAPAAATAAAPAATISSQQVSALPLVAQLPFLLFGK